ncbi:MAG: hypothetical protein ACYTAS_06395 [Planctomycetota bacterium]|jgi:hypothetical protein
MGTVLLIVVVLAAVATIASGVWVAVGLLAALGNPRRVTNTEAGTDDHDSA